VGFLEGKDGGVGLSHLNEDESFQDKCPAGEVGVSLLGLAVEEEVLGLVEELEGFWEAPLCRARWRLEGQKARFVTEDVSDAGDACFPPGLRHVENGWHSPLGTPPEAPGVRCARSAGKIGG